MLWTRITSGQLDEARVSCAETCLLPFGCLERHSDHLPLGTDSMLAYRLAELAAESEPAVVFPPQHYMMVASAASHSGAVVFDAKLSMQIVETVVSEIARNGFHKIIFYNFHGGNRNILPLLLQNHLTQGPADTVLYLPRFDWEIEDVYKTYCSSDFGGHADEWETSLMLALFPETVSMQDVPTDDVGRSRKLLSVLHEKRIKTPVDFFADFPTHYAGESKSASAEKGEQAVRAITTRLAEVIRTVKQDRKAPELLLEFRQGMKSAGESSRRSG